MSIPRTGPPGYVRWSWSVGSQRISAPTGSLMGAKVARVVQPGRLPNQDGGEQGFWEPRAAAVPGFTQPATDDAAAAVLEVGSAGRARQGPQVSGVARLTGSPLLGHDLATVPSAS